jgi:hypothetical protein
MTKYKCDKGHEFLFPETAHVGLSENEWTEFTICPDCDDYNRNISEVPDSAQAIGNVYVYELTTGAQTELDKLLADGYLIVNRYAKAYHLEKPKTEQRKIELK